MKLAQWTGRSTTKRRGVEGTVRCETFHLNKRDPARAQRAAVHTISPGQDGGRSLMYETKTWQILTLGVKEEPKNPLHVFTAPIYGKTVLLT